MQDNIFDRNKICVLIPTYNNAQTFESVLKGVLDYTDKVIVVNDGSTDETDSILSRYPVINKVSYSPNQGKGMALRRGFDKAAELGFDYAISIDSDGQHYPDDLPLFAEAIEKNSGALIMGARNMEQESVPGKSSFGNKFSNFWYKVETGITLSDTQSGYRLYPVQRLKGISFFTRKFEFEIEVLVRSAWRGIPVKQIPVKVFYPEKEKRISHFRPFQDFSRISVLNTVLVTIAFLYIKPRDFFRKLKSKGFRQVLKETFADASESKARKSASVGFGIFMGIVPIWGFQLAVGIPLAFLFRLNKALFLIAANISLPPMIPFILYASHYTGGLLLGDEAQKILFSDMFNLNTMPHHLWQYIIGAWTLASVAGITFGVVTYLVLKLSTSKR